MTSTLSLNELRQFSGDDIRFRHALNRRVIYTPGIQYLAEVGGAYWLIDEIALALGSPAMQLHIAADSRLAEMQFWTLTVHPDESALLTASADSDVAPCVSKRIPWTDFPLPKIDIWCAWDGANWTLYLPSEH